MSSTGVPPLATRSRWPTMPTSMPPQCSGPWSMQSRTLLHASKRYRRKERDGEGGGGKREK